MRRRPWAHGTSAVIALAIAVLVVPTASAYWAPNHRQINRSVAQKAMPFDFSLAYHQIRTLNDYVSTVFLVNNGTSHELNGVTFKRSELYNVAVGGTSAVAQSAADTPDDAPTEQRMLVGTGAGAGEFGWNDMGGQWEDGFANEADGMMWGGYRAVNHFHNPIGKDDGAYHGITPIEGGASLPFFNLLRTGISAATWARGTSSNPWGVNGLSRSFETFFTSTHLDDRQKGLANAFRALGQLEHLVEDNTVPDHTRDLPHPGDGFEEFMKNNRAYASLFEIPPPYDVLPLSRVDATGFRGFWDQDVYDGTNPASVADEHAGVGISEFTCANYLAYNLFNYPWYNYRLKSTYSFTTVPNGPNQGYLGPVGRTDLPWPQVAGPFQPPTPDDWPSAPGSKPVSHLAFGPSDDGSWNSAPYFLRAQDWSEYARPLMRMAHGYAQTMLAFALPPIRAEIVPDETAPLSSVRVRLWNEGADAGAGSLDGITWHVGAVKIRPIVPAPPTNVPNLQIDDQPVDVPISGTVDVAPGGYWQSAPISLSIAQRGAFAYSSHTMVMVDAQFGNVGPVDMTFGMAIPGSLASIEQADAADADAGFVMPARFDQSCGSDCGTNWGNGFAFDALHQTATGMIHLYPTKRDIFGDPATPDLEAFEADEARISGIALVVLNSPTDYNLADSVPPPASSLVVDNQDFEQISPWLWRRKATLPKNPSPIDVPFSVNLDIAGDAIQDGSGKAADNYLIVAWTVSGSQWVQKLGLWYPPQSNRDASGVIASLGTCPPAPGLSTNVLAAAYSRTCDCGLDSTTQQCRNFSISLGAVSMTSGLMSATSNPGTLPSEVAYFSLFGNLVPTTLGGASVSVTQDVPAACSPDEYGATGGPCDTGSATTWADVQAQQGDGPCAPESPAPTLPSRTASFMRDAPKLNDILKDELGWAQPLNPPEIELR